jgi:hypothetical protein
MYTTVCLLDKPNFGFSYDAVSTKGCSFLPSSQALSDNGQKPFPSTIPDQIITFGHSIIRPLPISLEHVRYHHCHRCYQYHNHRTYILPELLRPRS